MNINEALIEGKGNIIIKYTLVIPNSGASVDLNITVSSGKPNNDSVSIIISDEDDGNGIELLQSYLKDHYGDQYDDQVGHWFGFNKDKNILRINNSNLLIEEAPSSSENQINISYNGISSTIEYDNIENTVNINNTSGDFKNILTVLKFPDSINYKVESVVTSVQEYSKFITESTILKTTLSNLYNVLSDNIIIDQLSENKYLIVIDTVCDEDLSKNTAIPIINEYFNSDPNSGFQVTHYCGSNNFIITNNIICFRKGSKVFIDNIGYKNIEDIQRGEYIKQNKVLGIVSEKLNGKIVKIQKNAIAFNVPCVDTFVTHNHKLYHNNYTFIAKNLINGKTVTEEEINDTVYNVLLDKFIYHKMNVNNIECETLHPMNSKAIKYYKNYVAEEVKNKNSAVLRFYSFVRNLIPL